MSGSSTAADRVAQGLYRAGCRFAFGIPGGEVLGTLDALQRAGVQFVLTKHENNAGFMAEAVYQRTGVPGILLATLGPGVVNAANVVANAQQDRVPLVVLSGCVDAEEAASYTHQILDHKRFFEPITKASFRLSAESAGLLVDKALAIARDDRPGPVHLDLPIREMGKSSAGLGGLQRARSAPVGPSAGPDLERAREWLAKAQRPVLVAGLDVLNHGAGDALATFVEHFEIPVITTYKAKGVIAEDHPLCLGGAGLSPLADRHLLPLVRSADLVVLAGYDPIEMRSGWRSVWDPGEQHVLELSAEPNTHYMHQAGISFVGHVGAGLRQLQTGPGTGNTWPDGEPERVRQTLKTSFDQGEAWGPTAIVEVTRQLLARDAIATVDSGAHRILLNQVWESYEPRTLLQSTGWCTMGCALPLAIGTKLVAPERQVVCFTGDAGLEMVLGELATARDLELSVIVVVFVDRSLALIELKQRAMHLPNNGVDFGGTDFAAVATALGGCGINVSDRAQLRHALQTALQSAQFSLIACQIEHPAYDGRL